MDPQVLDPLRLVVRGLSSSLSLPIVSNHAYTITQRLSQYLLFPSPQVSLSDAPFLGAQGGNQSPLLPIGIGSCLGQAPGPYLILWAFLVSWSVPLMSPVGAQLSRESVHWSERELGIPSGGAPPRSSLGSSALTGLSHQSGGSRGQRG